MSEVLVFSMGEFPAELPVEIQYASNHMWAERRDEIYRFGFTAYAVRLLQDVYFLDWNFDAGVEISQQQELGSIESKKAESSLYAPIGGQLTIFNQQLMADPSGINLDKYGDGWLFEIDPSDDNTADDLMTAQQYVDHLDEVWKITQRTIKGQLN